MQDDDRELLERWRQGDQSAGRQLFERSFKGLYRFFSNKATQDVEDLIQTTLLACLEKSEKIESFRAFLYGTARHILFKRFEEGERGRRFDPAASSLEDLAPSPSQIVATDHDSRLLTSALRRIPLDTQILLELIYWEGMSQRELLELYGGTPGVLKGKIAAAKKQLRERLEELRSRGFNSLSTVDVEEWEARITRPDSTHVS